MIARELAALFDGALHPVAALRSGRFIYGNPAFCTWLGHDHFRGQALWDLCELSTRTAVQAAACDLRPPPELLLQLTDGRTADAAVCDLHLDGEPLRVLRLKELPATSRHKAALPEDLISVDTPLWDLLAGARLGFWLVDAQGRTILCNPHAAETLGVDLEALHATTLFDRLPVDGMGLPEGTHHLQLTRPDGTHIFLEAAFSHFHDESGAPAGALVLLRDVSAQRQVMQELQRSETRFHVLAATAQSALALMNTRGRLYEVNAAAERMFGYSRAEFMGGAIRIKQLYVHDHERVRAVETTRRDGRVVDIPVTFRRKDGSEFQALMDVTLFQDGDEERFAVSVVDAASLGPVHSELMRHREDLHRVVERLNETLQGPLVTLTGFLRTLAGDSEPLERLQRASRTIARTLHQLQGYTQLLSALPHEPCALKPIALDAVHTLRDEVAATRASITVEDLPTIPGHAPTLHAALQELVHNALRFSSPHRAPQLRIRGTVDGKMVVLRVEDNGTGIPEGARANVFELFTTTGTHPACGAGIGLAYVRRAAEHHGGRAWAEDSELGGACICMELRAE